MFKLWLLRFFERDLVKRVNAHLDAIGFNAATVTLDLNPNVIVHNAFQTDNDLVHYLAPESLPKWGIPRGVAIVQDCCAVYKGQQQWLSSKVRQ